MKNDVNPGKQKVQKSITIAKITNVWESKCNELTRIPCKVTCVTVWLQFLGNNVNTKGLYSKSDIIPHLQ